MFLFLRQSLPRSRSVVLPLWVLCTMLGGAVRAQGLATPDFETLAQDWLREATHTVQSVGVTP
jgi:hypothetical protein